MTRTNCIKCLRSMKEEKVEHTRNEIHYNSQCTHCGIAYQLICTPIGASPKEVTPIEITS